MKVIEDEVIDAKSITNYLTSSMQFEYCEFKNCDFTAHNLSGFSFMECQFIDCDLSGVPLINTAFKEVKFTDCKLMGLHFDQCNEFLLAMNFYRCKLDFSIFFKLKLQTVQVINCSCKECDFTEANFSGASFESTDLTGAMFRQTNLQKADFSNAVGLLIDPEVNNIKKARFDMNQLAALLVKHSLLIN